MCQDPFFVPPVLEAAGGVQYVPIADEYTRLEGYRWANSWEHGLGSVFCVDSFGSRGEAVLVPKFCRVVEPASGVYIEAGARGVEAAWLRHGLEDLCAKVADSPKLPLAELMTAIKHTTSITLVVPAGKVIFKEAASSKEFSRRAARRHLLYVDEVEMGARLRLSIVPPAKTASGDPDNMDAAILMKELGAQLFQLAGQRGRLCVRRQGGPPLDGARVAGAPLADVCDYLTSGFVHTLSAAPSTWARLNTFAKPAADLESSLGPVPGRLGIFNVMPFPSGLCECCGQDPAVGLEVAKDQPEKKALAVCQECLAFVPGSAAFLTKAALSQHTGMHVSHLVGGFDSGLDDALDKSQAAAGVVLDEKPAGVSWSLESIEQGACVLAVGGMMSLRPGSLADGEQLQEQLRLDLQAITGCRKQDVRILTAVPEADTTNVLVPFLLLHPAISLGDQAASDEALDPFAPLRMYHILESALKEMTRGQARGKRMSISSVIEEDKTAPKLVCSHKNRVLLPCSLFLLRPQPGRPRFVFTREKKVIRDDLKEFMDQTTNDFLAQLEEGRQEEPQRRASAADVKAELTMQAEESERADAAVGSQTVQGAILASHTEPAGTEASLVTSHADDPERAEAAVVTVLEKEELEENEAAEVASQADGSDRAEAAVVTVLEKEELEEKEAAEVALPVELSDRAEAAVVTVLEKEELEEKEAAEVALPVELSDRAEAAVVTVQAEEQLQEKEAAVVALQAEGSDGTEAAVVTVQAEQELEGAEAAVVALQAERSDRAEAAEVTVQAGEELEGAEAAVVALQAERSDRAETAEVTMQAEEELEVTEAAVVTVPAAQESERTQTVADTSLAGVQSSRAETKAEMLQEEATEETAAAVSTWQAKESEGTEAVTAAFQAEEVLEKAEAAAVALQTEEFYQTEAAVKASQAETSERADVATVTHQAEKVQRLEAVGDILQTGEAKRSEAAVAPPQAEQTKAANARAVSLQTEAAEVISSTVATSQAEASARTDAELQISNALQELKAITVTDDNASRVLGSLQDLSGSSQGPLGSNDDVVEGTVLDALSLFQPTPRQLALRVRELVAAMMPLDEQAKCVGNLLSRWGQSGDPCSSDSLAAASRDPSSLRGQSSLDISIKMGNHQTTLTLLSHVPCFPHECEGPKALTAAQEMARLLNGHNPVTGHTLLYAAVLYPSKHTVVLVDKLLQRKVDINIPGSSLDTRQAETALVNCARRADSHLVLHMLEKQAEVNTKAEDGKSLLQVAVGRPDESILATILQVPGLEANCVDKEGRTALVTALRGGQGCLGAIRRLLAARCDASKKDKGGIEPLVHAATSLRDPELCQAFLACRKAPLPEGSKSGDSIAFPGGSPLHLAARARNEEMLCALLAARAKPDIREEEGRTPLHLAAGLGLKRSVADLLKARADACAAAATGETPLRIAVLCSTPPPPPERQSKPPRPRPTPSSTEASASIVTAAVTTTDTKIVELLLGARADPNKANFAGCRPLHAACMAGNLSLAKLLVSRRASVTLTDKRRWSPLHFAAFGGSAPMVQWLLNAKADAEARTFHGQSARDLAKPEFTDVTKIFECTKHEESLSQLGLTLEQKVLQALSGRQARAVTPRSRKKVRQCDTPELATEDVLTLLPPIVPK
eukprot:TRINITY_DN2106_c0_g1_i7.p1 TRINITY_DN2106_c0_g1~~TRINITY_DN2106_c0_g1_i7.p1  ORF type:complete len:1760 (-),score=463.03 TRINITY_DN2106_c0_g1_i7:5-4948(-)